MPLNAVILEDVKKLLQLGLSKEQLVRELSGMGISRAEAEQLYQAATGATSYSTTTASSHADGSYEIPPTAFSMSTPARAAAQPTPTYSSPNYSPASNTSSNSPPAPPRETPVILSAPKPDDSLEKLWEKGIIATVDARLAQMEQLKKDIDSVLESKIAERTRAQEKKIEVLFESQRDLVMAKTDASLASKTKEVDEILTQKIEEIKRINLATQEDLQRIKGQRLIAQELMGDLTTKTALLDQFRRTLNDDVARKLEQMQIQVNELLQTSEARLQEAELRASQTLQLEERIASGLAQQVEQQANLILDSRIKDLRLEIQNEIQELKRLELELSPEQVEARVSELNSRIDKRILDVEQQFSSKEMDARVQKVIEQKQRTMLQYLDAEVNKMKSDLEEKAHSVQEVVKELNTAKQSLDEYAAAQKKALDDMQHQSNATLDSRMAQINQTVDASIRNYIDAKEKEIASEINTHLPEIQTLKVDLLDRQKNLSRLLSEADNAKVAMEELAQKKLVQLDSALDAKMAGMINAKEKEFNARVSEGMEEISRTRSELSQKSVEVQALKDNIDLFKDQFLTTLKQANIERQDEAKVFRQKMADFDAKSDAKIALVDDRLAKLDAIINQLAQTLQQMPLPNNSNPSNPFKK